MGRSSVTRPLAVPHEPCTPYPVFEFHPGDGEIPGVTAEMYGQQPRRFDLGFQADIDQHCLRCGTDSGLLSTNCSHDQFVYCEACQGWTLHHITVYSNPKG